MGLRCFMSGSGFEGHDVVKKILNARDHILAVINNECSGEVHLFVPLKVKWSAVFELRRH
jgi:hypothetical protein